MLESDPTPGDRSGQPEGRRRLPAAQRRALILQAALRTFAEHGYEGAAMDEIAAAAGVSKAVVYDHVSSKQDLYMSVLDAIRAELEQTVEDAVAPAGIEGEQRVRNAVDAVFRYVDQHREASRLLLFELQGANVSPIGRALGERITAVLAGTLSDVTDLLRDHPRRDTQLEILAELIRTGFQGLVAWWFRHPDVARDELVERTVAVIWPAIERALVPRASAG